MKMVVQKFGGTSLEDNENFKYALKHIKRELELKHKIVCVASAMGRSPKPYATDTLKNLISYQLSKKEQDRLLACGEVISSIVFTDFLLQNGIKATSLSAKEIGIITDDHFNNANIIEINDDKIRAKLEAYDVVVVPGFQGITRNHDVTTLGRGGSDTTAIALGIKLKALYVDIISDVEGIMTADPKIVKNAKKITQINYDTLLDITKKGAKVLHYKAALLAKKSKIKLYFRSIKDVNVKTEVVDKNVNTISITYKSGYTKYKTTNSLTETIVGTFFEDYGGEYFTNIINEEIIDEFLMKSNIMVTKEYGYVKISLINHKNAKIENSIFISENELNHKLVSIHNTIFEN